MGGCGCVRQPCRHRSPAFGDAFPDGRDADEEQTGQTPYDFAYNDDTERIWTVVRGELDRILALDEAWIADSPRSELLRQAYARIHRVELGPHAAAKTAWADEGPLEAVWHATRIPLTISAVPARTGAAIRTRCRIGRLHDRHADDVRRAIGRGEMPVPAATLAVVDGELHLLHSIPVGRDRAPTHATQLAHLAPRHASHAHAIAHHLRRTGILHDDPEHEGPRPGLDPHLRPHATPARDPAAGTPDIPLAREQVQDAADRVGMRAVADRAQEGWLLTGEGLQVRIAPAILRTPGVTPERGLTITTRRTGTDGDGQALQPSERWEQGEAVISTVLAQGGGGGGTALQQAFWPAHTLRSGDDPRPDGPLLAGAVRLAAAG